MSLIRLRGGRLVDPSGDEADRVGDLYLRGDRIVAPPSDVVSGDVQTIPCEGCVVMAGGIDLHTHIGGGKVSLARMLMPEAAGSAFLPDAGAAGRAYRSMGYTVAVEPAMPACNARQAHAEMADTPHLDTAAYVMLGNDRVLLELLAADAPQPLINDYVGFMVTATQAIGVKVVNAGGIDAFKFNQRKLDVDTPHPKFGVTPAQIIRRLSRAVYELGIPHPLHVHCSNLGVPGNVSSTLATIRAAAGLPIHITHVQFHSYAAGGPKGFSSAAAQIADAVNRNPNVTVDVGQVMFGQTVTISGDTMHQYVTSRFAKPRKSVLVDIECEAGCGVVPFRYRNRRFVHCLQWAIGLELFLMIDDPSRVFLTTDHPNGGPFTSYPHLIRLLTDRSFRETALAEIDGDAAAASELSGMAREYSLADVARMTRSGPARILGLSDRGTLAPGVSADVVVYREGADREQMFRRPREIFRGGVRIDGDRLAATAGGEGAAGGDPNDDPLQPEKVTHTVRPEFDLRSVARFAAIHAGSASFAFENLVISDEEMLVQIGSRPVVHPCRGRS